MKSTSGEHFVALDHVRAIAALLVFVWHFIHGPHGELVPMEGAPVWSPLVLFDEGHVGVALFMTLSGYLFAKLLDGKRIIYPLFFWNRLLRLMPLLFLVFAIHATKNVIQTGDMREAFWYLQWLQRGLVFPTWPNGGWSIAVELHFYLLLPLLLFLRKRWYPALWILVASAILFRVAYYAWSGEVQTVAYWTIVGRIDQFLLGIIAFHHRARLINRHALVAGILVVFVSLYWAFDTQGGFSLRPTYPSPSRLWAVLPTLEGFAFAALIAWYDGSFTHRTGPVSNILRKFGEYSYSIYLLHFFIVFIVAEWIHLNIIDLSNFYIALPVALLAFLAMFPIGFLSMRFVEGPFLKLRQPYTTPESPTAQELEALQKVVAALKTAYELSRNQGAQFVVVFAPTTFRVYHDIDLPDRFRRMVAEISPDIDYLDLTPTLRSQAEKGTQFKKQVTRDLTHEAMMVRNQDGEIRYWSKGAQQLYGWPPQEALGESSHRLLKTVFPKSLETIEEELRTKGYWEGQLLHKRRDGSQVVVASRWELQEKTNDQSATVLEISSERSF